MSMSLVLDFANKTYAWVGGGVDSADLREVNKALKLPPRKGIDLAKRAQRMVNRLWAGTPWKAGRAGALVGAHEALFYDPAYQNLRNLIGMKQDPKDPFYWDLPKGWRHSKKLDRALEDMGY